MDIYLIPGRHLLFMHEILLIARSIMHRSFLHHLRRDFNTRYAVRARRHLRLNIYRIQIIFVLLRLQLRLACVKKTMRPARCCKRPSTAFVVVGWHELGEY